MAVNSGRVKPQILTAMIIVGIMGFISIFKGLNEIAAACVVGEITLGRELLEKDGE